MSQQPAEIYLPRLPLWLMRIAADERISARLLSNAVAFSSWYAIMADSLQWPVEVLELQQTCRTRKLSMERMMKLLDDLSHATASSLMSSDHARRILEGYAVHDWVSQHEDTFRKLCTETLPDLKIVADAASTSARVLREVAVDQDRSQSLARSLSFDRKLRDLAYCLGLSPLEGDILALCVVSAASNEITSLLRMLTRDHWTATSLWSTVFETNAGDLSKAMRPSSPLRLSGILRPIGDRSQMATVSSFWLQLLTESTSLTQTILEPLDEVKTRSGSGIPARLLDDDFALASQILANASHDKGVNLLLYGAGSLDKEQLMRQLVAQSQRKAWRVRRFEDAGGTDLPALVYVALRLLAIHQQENGELSVIVVDRPTDALKPNSSRLMRMLFGIEAELDDIPEFDENLLSTNEVPALWVTSNISGLPDETVARFVFHAPLKRANKQQRQEAMQEMLNGVRLSKAARECILKLEGVSRAQIDAAVRAARLSGAKTTKARDTAVIQAIHRSQKALARELQAKTRVPVTQYSLEYLNTAGRFKPDQILQAFRRNPKGAMVLYGPPGTGKTQFVEHMAQTLGLPLVAKRASELLSKWLGESEKNLAAAFEEAASEGAILLLDEGDSFLRERSLARASHEVTQVNELLQLIERFDGIVVVCTNLFSGLDAAALRRFTFKIEFRQLSADQRWSMFLNETGLREPIAKSRREEMFERLCMMKQLTPGDFATVQRQCKLLGIQLSPQEWLDQLQIECDVKVKPKEEFQGIDM